MKRGTVIIIITAGLLLTIGIILAATAQPKHVIITEKINLNDRTFFRFNDRTTLKVQPNTYINYNVGDTYERMSDQTGMGLVLISTALLMGFPGSFAYEEVRSSYDKFQS